MAGLLAGLVAACGKKEPPPPPPPPPPLPPPPTVVSLTLKARSDVNLDPSGVAKPLQVHVLRLASPTELLTADPLELATDPQATLGKSLLGFDTLVLSPGSTEVYQRQLEEGVRFIAVTGSYRDAAANWRAAVEVPRNATTLLEAELDARGIAVRKAGL
jgi:type VI secretion system VasD/TssJ family lipoprotein